MRISLVIPAMKEEEGIKKTLSNIPYSKLKKNGYDIETIVVWTPTEDDKTGEIADKMGAEVIIEKRRGYGRAYKTGFQNTNGDIIATLDADCTYPVEKIPELINLLECEKIDFITTDRFADLERGIMKPLHRFGNFILTLWMNLLFGLKINDSQSGMWVFRKKILDAIQLKENGMTFSSEIKIKAFKKFKIREVPIKYKRREGVSKISSLKDGFAHVKYMFRERLGF